MIPRHTLARFITSNERLHPESTGELSDLLMCISVGVKMISSLVATAGFKGLHGYSGRVNVQGEETSRLDDEADAVLVELLGASDNFGLLVSEERDDAIQTESNGSDAKYVVAFDPLDGSSNIGSNIPVGTIFTILRKLDPKGPATKEDFLQNGRSVVAAGYSVYGAKTSFVYSCGNGVHGFTLDPEIGEFVLTEEDMKIPARGPYYSVNEGYNAIWGEKMRSYVSMLKSEDAERGLPYSSRYVGSLVADFDRTLRKGGIFLHPANSKRERGKLRLLYECMPLAFILEVAGGRATDGIKNVLDVDPVTIHDRCPFIAGGVDDMALFEDAMK